MKEKLLIVGGTGFIGFHLAKEGIKKGFEVYSLSKNPPIDKRYLSEVVYIHVDLLNKENLSNYLENLEIIQSMKLSSISPNQIIFEVETSADIKFLSRAINGFEFLTQENEVKSDQANLNFNWVD